MTPLSGRIEKGRHIFPIRVFYEDTDASGVVYNANYLRFVERARTEMMRLIGFEHSRLLAETAVAFAVRRAAIDFARPARLDDVVEVWTTIDAMTGARLDITQRVRRGDEELATLRLELVCVKADGRPARLPAALRHAVSRIASET